MCVFVCMYIRFMFCYVKSPLHKFLSLLLLLFPLHYLCPVKMFVLFNCFVTTFYSTAFFLLVVLFGVFPLVLFYPGSWVQNCAVQLLCFFSFFFFYTPWNFLICFFYFSFWFLDENRDINIHHIDDDIKRQRIHYSGDQIYPNVSSYHMIMIIITHITVYLNRFGQINGVLRMNPKHYQLNWVIML